MTSIYCLIDPLDKNIKYVGRTFVPLKTRLNAHIYHPANKKMKEWILSLSALSEKPIIQKLHTVNTGNSHIYENEWIDFFKQNGVDLLNYRMANSYQYIRPSEKKAYFTFYLSEESVNKLKKAAKKDKRSANNFLQILLDNIK